MITDSQGIARSQQEFSLIIRSFELDSEVQLQSIQVMTAQNQTGEQFSHQRNRKYPVTNMLGNHYDTGGSTGFC